MTRHRLSFLLINAAVAFAYSSLGFVFLTLAHFGASAPLWPPAGLAFAVALRWRWRVAPGILIGSLVANTTFLSASDGGSTPLLAAVPIAVGATAQALVAAALVRRFVADPNALRSARDILLFLALAGPAASIINATIGTATQVLTDVIPADRASLAWVIWWAGDSMGVIVFGPLVLMLLPDPTSLWTHWKWRVGLPSVAFAAVLMIAIMASVDAETDRLDTQREHAAENASSLLLDQLQREQEILQGIGDLFHASKQVDAKGFRVYTMNPLNRYGSLQALAWDISLTPGELPEFIAERREQPGGADYTATERDSDGTIRPVSPGRDQYVLVDYVEPLTQNREALGYDIASDPARRSTIERAQVTGEISATPPIELIQRDARSGTGMLALNPVYDRPGTPATVAERLDQIRGFSVGVYELDTLLATVFTAPGEPGNWDSMGIELVDITDPSSVATLAALDTSQTATTTTEVTGPPMSVMGREWQLILTPVSGPLSQPPLGASPYLLLVALAGLYLLEALLILLTTRESQAQREAQERTQEANHDALTGLLNRRGFIRRLELICDDADHGQGESVLLFCDLDRFKAINDVAGHEAGDRLLQAVATILREHVRQSDVVARLGGDEFALILVKCPMDKAVAIASSIWTAIQEFRLPTSAGDLSVSVSIGAASIGGEACSPDEALRRSDSAAYAAKKSGEGGVSMYSEATQV
jgi:diguanylate cyclase (GGDEF)-like protein